MPVLAVSAALLLSMVLLASRTASAQPDTLRLGVLHEAATAGDPRMAQLDLYERQAELRVENFAAGWFPQVALTSQVTYQSETASIPAGAFGGGGITLPNLDVPEPPRDQYEVAAEAEQLLYDGGRLARGARAERARREENQATVRANLYVLRQQVDRAFFAALLQQERRAQMQTLAEDLVARRRFVAAQARGGAALGADVAAVDAELIDVRQELDRVEGARLAALASLASLARRDIRPADVLAVPDLEVEAEAAIASLAPVTEWAEVERGAESVGGVARRPELRQFEHVQKRLRAEAAAAEAEGRPRISAFARAAYGRPGFDFFDETFRPYAVVGLRARWSLLDWSATDRRAAALRVQADVVETEVEAFTDRVRREVLAVTYDIERLEAALASDERAVTLREEVERVARRQLEEGTLATPEYVDRRTDVFETRLRRRVHRVELAQARARLLAIVGRDLPLGGPQGIEMPVERAAPPFTYDASPQ